MLYRCLPGFLNMPPVAAETARCRRVCKLTGEPVASSWRLAGHGADAPQDWHVGEGTLVLTSRVIQGP